MKYPPMIWCECKCCGTLLKYNARFTFRERCWTCWWCEVVLPATDSYYLRHGS